MSKFKKGLKKLKKLSYEIQKLDNKRIDNVLKDLSELIRERQSEIIKQNKKDLKQMDELDPKYDRLKLTEERIIGIAESIMKVRDMNSPISDEIEKKRLRNGLKLRKIRVPLGVIGIIYESRPNVTIDVFSLTFKSKNVCVLKGGKEATNSNKAFIQLIKDALSKHEIDPESILYFDDRRHTKALLNAVEDVDLIIPRGGQSLINFVRDNSKVPVIETGAGVVHTYFDKDGDIKKGKDIIHNAKTRRPSVCNSLDTLIIHEDRLKELPKLIIELENYNVEIFADFKARNAIQKFYKADLLHEAADKHYGTEFLDYKMSIKTVRDIDEALSHIREYSSKHSEAIITESRSSRDRFFNEVDAACVYHNTSTAFTDGEQFEMGAEIGISTQKLHARGPMALKELTSYKWIIEGDGQVRS
jgi:glutamate-5-semialdehyde dehydrogenase